MKRRRKQKPIYPEPLAAKDYYASHEWRSLRRSVLRRGGGACQYCGSTATTADHVIARGKRGPDSDINLVAVCNNCNACAGGMPFASFEEKRDFILASRRIDTKPTLGQRLRAYRAESAV